MHAPARIVIVAIRFREPFRRKDDSGWGRETTPFEAELGHCDAMQDRPIWFDNRGSARIASPLVVCMNDGSDGVFDVGRSILGGSE